MSSRPDGDRVKSGGSPVKNHSHSGKDGSGINKKPLANSHNTSSSNKPSSGSKPKDPNAKPKSKEPVPLKVILLSDGTKIKTMPDGSKIKVMPDGRKFKMKSPTSSTSAPKPNNSSHSSKPRDGSPPSRPPSSSNSVKSESNNKVQHKESSSSKHRDTDVKREPDAKPRESSSSTPKASSSSIRSKEKSSSKDVNSKPRESSSSNKSDSSKHSSSKSQKPVEVKKEKVEQKPVTSPVKVKEEPSSPVKSIKKEASPVRAVKQQIYSDDDEGEDDMPLDKRLTDGVKEEPRESSRRSTKRPHYAEDDDEEEEEDQQQEEDESEDDVPLSHRKDKSKKVKSEPTPKKEKKTKKRKKEESDEDFAAEDSEDDYKPRAKQKKTEKTKSKTKEKADKGKKDKKGKKEPEVKKEKGGRKKKVEEQQEVWEWWKETPHPEGVKWMFLEHKGPLFAPEYEPLPKGVKFLYDGKEMKLSEPAEEVAGFYARMIEHDYTTRDVFNNNFFKDWRKVMTHEEKEKITSLKKCNFKQIHAYYQQKSEERKAMSKEGKAEIKKKNEEIQKEYGFCKFDGHKEKIGNFRVEPPGLFRGRGEHPKQGMLKKRIYPEDVIINCSKDSQIPEPPAGHKWKKVIHDNTVTWLCSWTENIQGAIKYVMLNPSSRIKGEKDWAKYEMARKLKECVERIRNEYREDWKSKEMRVRQRAVALYFIDKLALRAGNEKEEGETADTVGCCSLRVEHLELHEEKDGKEFVVDFDFLGKDSIRYQNSVQVEKRVFKNLKLFMENKQGEDNLFDRLNTTILNKYLQELMEGLTAKVFRTYNASITLQNQLELLTEGDDNIAAKILSYNRANRAVAILCNHQRAVPKTFGKQMENLQEKINKKQDDIRDARKQLKALKSEYKSSRNEKLKGAVDKKKKQVERLEEQMAKLEMTATDKEENKDIALGTSKLNYLDPRISAAWCKKWEVPVEKIYNRTQRDKFRWAIDMAGADFVF